MIFTPALNGQLAIGTFHDATRLSSKDCDSVISLIRTEEGQIIKFGELMKINGLHWFHRPIRFQGHEMDDKNKMCRAAVNLVHQQLITGNIVFVHCSQGIHRSGLVCYCALRLGGLGDNEAVETIGRTRPSTVNALTDRVRELYEKIMG